MRWPRYIAARVAIVLGTIWSAETLADDYETDALMHLGKRLITADQWGLEAIGLDARLRKSLFRDQKRMPIVVAVIDSGVDDRHPDLPSDRLWINEKEPINGLDDDGNGFVDDRYGWDFIDSDNNPWDELGHGTHAAGVIAAETGNGIGIAGIDGHAIIMPLRALNLMGRGYSTRVAAAIYYAVDQGAAIINLSMATQALSAQERRAVNYAVARNVLVVAAAGNEGSDADAFTPGAIPGVLTVAAAARDGSRAGFSNFGASVDITAPGVDIVSLRALNTDFASLLIDGPVSESSRVGPKHNYYRASGTSFAAPFVTGAAALLKSLNPALSATDIARILKNSARDIDAPGIDANTGYGMLDLPAALAAEPGLEISCRIDGVEVLNKGGQPFIGVMGTAYSDRLSVAELSLGKGAEAQRFGSPVLTLGTPVRQGSLGQFDARSLAGATEWTLRLMVKRKKGTARECRYRLSLGS